jgi:hypothetical protein
MTKSLLRGLLALALVFWLACPGTAQGLSISQLRQQIAEKEAVDRDPTTSAGVKALNRRLLNEQRLELVAELKKEIANFQKYETDISHSANERKVIEESINSLHAELAELQRTIRPEPAPGADTVAGTEQSPPKEPLAVKTSLTAKPARANVRD